MIRLFLKALREIRAHLKYPHWPAVQYAGSEPCCPRCGLAIQRVHRPEPSKN